LKEEKKRVIGQAAREKDEIKKENKQLSMEIQRLKILIRHGGAAIGAELMRQE
jgi:hypothetical protein